MKKLLLKTKTITASLLIIFLSNCVSTVSHDRMIKETAEYELPKSPENGNALVYVVRPSMIGTLVRFNVFLDDKNDDSEMGYNRGNQYIFFSVKPGQHKIYSKAETWDEIDLNVESGKVYFLQQSAKMGIIMARNKLDLLDEVRGKYHVKNSKLGTFKRVEK